MYETLWNTCTFILPKRIFEAITLNITPTLLLLFTCFNTHETHIWWKDMDLSAACLYTKQCLHNKIPSKAHSMAKQWWWRDDDCFEWVNSCVCVCKRCKTFRWSSFFFLIAFITQACVYVSSDTLVVPRYSKRLTDWQGFISNIKHVVLGSTTFLIYMLCLSKGVYHK